MLHVSEHRSAALCLALCVLAWGSPGRAGEATPPEETTSEAETTTPEADAGTALQADANAALERGAELYRRGDFSGAIESWREAAGFLVGENADAAPRRVELLTRIADAEQALGQYRDAVRTLEEALRLAGGSAEPAQLAAIHGSLGNALIALGPLELADPDRPSARRELERGIELARGADAPGVASPILLNLGNLHAAQQRYPDALRAYDESAELARSTKSLEVAARALANAASVSLLADSTAAEVRRRLDEARSLAPELPPSHDKAYLLTHLGRTYTRLGESGSETPPGETADLARAHELYVEAEKIADDLGDRLAASYAVGYRAQLYEDHGRLDESLELTRRARFLAQEANAPEALYLWDWQLGRILKARGETTPAIESYKRAVEELQGIRFEMAHGYATGESSFRRAVGPVFFELVDLLLATAPPAAEQAALQQRLLEARETIEDLKAAELRDYFRDECVDEIESKVESPDQLSRTAVVVYPILLADRTELLVTSPLGIRRRTVDVGAERLEAEARQLRRYLEKRTTLEYLPHAQQLYDWLVRPYEQDLAELAVDTIVFVPDGALRTIPMAALHDGKTFLVERFAVAMTPGLSLTDPRPLDRENLQVFLSGLSESVAGFPALAYVPGELSSIHELYGGTVLLDQDFQTSRVKSTLSDQEFGIVHIASHGQFSSDSDSSFLLAYDDRITMDRLSEYVGLFRFREQPIELLTLSACETAEGDDRAALGLAGVAIKAGARSALGTLWSVNDAAAAELVVGFYRQLQADTVSKAVALQRAQLALQGSGRYEHPFYWSPFLLISNWL